MSNKKILIVEDEAPIASALKIKLTKENYEVLSAVNGQEGLDLALREKPDLILLDIAMPVMDGLTMMEKLREKEEGRNLGILVLTNSTRQNDRATFTKYGIIDYLVKSQWKLESLVEKIKEIVK